MNQMQTKDIQELILVYSKLFQAYILSINALKNIITKYNSAELKFESITIDFEEGLYKDITIIFPNACIVGYFYHYMHNLTKNAHRLGMAKYQDLDLKKNIGILGKIPFVYYKDKNIIYKTFNNIYENLNKKIIINIKEFELYFNSVWIKYYENNLGCENLEKFFARIVISKIIIDL